MTFITDARWVLPLATAFFLCVSYGVCDGSLQLNANTDPTATPSRPPIQVDDSDDPPPGRRRRPNLVFLMTDQQTYRAVSLAAGDRGDHFSPLQTPHMDRIGREGAYFSAAHSICPVCGPARTSLLCGRSIEHTGVRTNTDASRNTFTNCSSYDHYLVRNEGYVAEYYGKWHSPPHMRSPYSNEMPESFRTPYRDYLKAYKWTKPPANDLPIGTQIQSFNRVPYVTDPLDHRHGLKPGSDKNRDGTKVSEPDQHGISLLPSEHTITAYQGREGLAALRRLAAAQQLQPDTPPFSLHLSFQCPHAPITSSQPYASYFNVSDLVPPPSLQDPMTTSPYQAANRRLSLPQYSDPILIRYMIRNYFAFVAELDEWVGQILGAIDDLALTNDTLLIFTSDHGEMLGAHGLREKNVFYEESVRVPLLIRYPNVIQSGTFVHHPVSHMDIFATILDYLGATARPSHGTSLRRFIEEWEQDGEPYAVSEWNYGAGTTPGLMMRMSHWKLLVPTTVESLVVNVLYDLSDDPYEMTNLLVAPHRTDASTSQAERLRTRLVEWLIQVHSPALEGVRNRVL